MSTKAAPKGKEERLDIRISTEERNLFERAAERVGLTVSAWLRMVARQAAAGK